MTPATRSPWPAYRGAFNPASVCDNFLGDPAGFDFNGVTRSFSFQVPASNTFQVVVTAVNNPECSSYTLEVNSPRPLPGAPGHRRAVPGQRRLDWPSSAGGYELERAPVLAPANWSAVTNQPVMNSGRFVLTNEVSEPAGFYRLRKP
jgi:hypothetical protein